MLAESVELSFNSTHFDIENFDITSLASLLNLLIAWPRKTNFMCFQLHFGRFLGENSPAFKVVREFHESKIHEVAITSFGQGFDGASLNIIRQSGRRETEKSAWLIADDILQICAAVDWIKSNVFTSHLLSRSFARVLELSLFGQGLVGSSSSQLHEFSSESSFSAKVKKMQNTTGNVKVPCMKALFFRHLPWLWSRFQFFQLRN